MSEAALKRGAYAPPKLRAIWPGRTYEVLRKSLQEAQKRCDSLNNDMMRQNEANDELMATLNTVKDSNRRLLDQIRQQTDEIQNLTQQRVLDEEAMENLRWQHQSDVDQAKQEAHRDMLALKDKADERVDIIKGYYEDKLRHLKTRMEIAKQEISGLRQVPFEQRQEVKL